MTSESKVHLYNRMLATRDELAPAEVSRMSDEIQRRVMNMEEYRTALRVGLYSAYKNAVRTEKLFIEGDKHRKEIYFPAVAEEGGGLSYYRVCNLEELLPHDEGFPQPTANQSRLRDVKNLGALIVPGVAFDLTGKRMGFSDGFYDESLRAFDGVRIALAYDFQVVPTLPMGPFERLIDWIVTEQRVIRCMR